MELLKVNLKSAGYGPKEVIVKDIDFSLKRGELIGLIGPNGSGKSTTIKAITGLLPYVQGEISFAGERKNYVYIPEQPVFYEELTLWEHIELAASAYELDGGALAERTEKLLKLFRLQGHRHELPVKFSKGMQQKVMIIVGFLINPDVYIVDEPFIGLDPGRPKSS